MVYATFEKEEKNDNAKTLLKIIRPVAILVVASLIVFFAYLAYHFFPKVGYFSLMSLIPSLLLLPVLRQFCFGAA